MEIAVRLAKMLETAKRQGDIAHELAKPSNPASPKRSKIEEVAAVAEAVAGTVQMVLEFLIELQREAAKPVGNSSPPDSSPSSPTELGPSTPTEGGGAP